MTWGVLFLGLAVAAPPPLVEVRNAGDPANRIEARVEVNVGRLERLSEEVRLAISVEGPGPLVVTLPKPFLTRPNVWRVRDDGLPLRELMANGREKWSHTYHLSPLLPGKQVIALGPLTIRAGSQPDLVLSWEEGKLPLIDVAEPKVAASVESLRPATDIEPLPPEPIQPQGRSGWLFAIVPGLLLLSAIALLLGRRKKMPSAPRDAVWAVRELAAVDLTPDRCARILRQYIGFRIGMPAEFQTTPELMAKLRSDERLSAPLVADWQLVLDECDAARFSENAGPIPDLADRAKSLVAGVETALATPPSRPAAAP